MSLARGAARRSVLGYLALAAVWAITAMSATTAARAITADDGSRPASDRPAAPSEPTDAMTWLSGEWIDHAPSGMPDFSQCRPAWSRSGEPGEPGQWTHAGPVALADVLWWLDSVAEPSPRPPATPSDGHALVTFYPVFGPTKDDHSPGNLGSLVEDLAFRLDTDGRRNMQARRGTHWVDFTAGAQKYVKDRRLSGVYVVEAETVPPAAWVTERAARGAGIVLFLGVWEAQGDAWKRVGGHYAAVAGSDPGEGGDPGSVRLALADPLADTASLGAPGRMVPADPTVHSCRTAHRDHDDPAVVAHDIYRLIQTPALPDGQQVLADYFTPDNYGEAAAFQGQNPAAGRASDAGDWQGGPVVMAIDGALAIVPLVPLGPSPTASATLSPSATATSTPTPSPTPPVTPTATPTATRRTMPSPTGLPRWRVYLPVAMLNRR